jgi:hypothetical protein
MQLNTGWHLQAKKGLLNPGEQSHEALHIRGTVREHGIDRDANNESASRLACQFCSYLSSSNEQEDCDHNSATQCRIATPTGSSLA